MQAHSSIERFKQTRRRMGFKHPKTALHYERVLNDLEAVLDGRDAANAAVEDIEELIHVWRQKGVSEQSIKTSYKCPVSQLYEYLIDHPVPGQPRMERNPVAIAMRWSFPKAAKQRQTYRRSLTLTELRHLLGHAHEPFDFTLCLLMAKTATREEEVANINDNDVTWTGPERGRIEIHPHPKRTNCRIWVDEETMLVLEAYKAIRPKAREGNPLLRSPSGGRIYERLVNRRIRAVADAAGLVKDWNDPMDKITSHVFRHTWTSYMRTEAEMPDVFVDDYRGDLRRGRMSDRYTASQEDRLRTMYLEHIWRLQETAVGPGRPASHHGKMEHASFAAQAA